MRASRSPADGAIAASPRVPANTPAPAQHPFERVFGGIVCIIILLKLYFQALLHQSRPPAVVDACCTQFAASLVHIIRYRGQPWPRWEPLNHIG